MKAYRSWNTFRGDAEISTWLYRITVNLCLNHIEQQKRRNFFQTAGDSLSDFFNRQSEENNPHQLLEEIELKKSIQTAIDALPDKQRTAFVLSKYDDLSQREIAAVMAITEGAGDKDGTENQHGQGHH